MLKLIHLGRAMRYAAWMERANDPHVLRSPKPPTVASEEPSGPTPPKKTKAKKVPRAK